MDPIYFSGRELLTIALKIEENGWAFYHEAQKLVEGDDLKRLFSFLAQQELKHIDDFKRLYKLLKDEKVKGYYDLTYDEDVSQYLNALADSRVFTDPSEGLKMARQLKDDREAFEIALRFEKDSLLFYYEMDKLVREDEREVVENIIEQEREHVQKLNELKKRESF